MAPFGVYVVDAARSGRVLPQTCRGGPAWTNGGRLAEDGRYQVEARAPVLKRARKVGVEAVPVWEMATG